MKPYRFLLIAAVILVCVFLPALTGCAPREEVKEEEPEKETETENPLDAGVFDAQGNLIKLAWYPDAKMNSLDDSLWVNENGFRYYQGKGYRTYAAIDVSSNQGDIDWEAVRDAGVECAIMRAGYRTYGGGIIKSDENCFWNLEQAKKAGIKTGVYFFSQAINTEEAEEEARFVLDLIDQFELDLPVYFDTEEINYDTARTDRLTGEELTENALAFCKYIENAGYRAGVYGNQMWLCNKLDLMQLEQYSIWVAKYTDELNYPYELDAWQYSSDGRVDGINTVVDMDVVFEKQ